MEQTHSQFPRVSHACGVLEERTSQLQRLLEEIWQTQGAKPWGLSVILELARSKGLFPDILQEGQNRYWEASVFGKMLRQRRDRIFGNGITLTMIQGRYIVNKTPIIKDHDRFQAWFADWRGVFANETQALAIWQAAQPEDLP